MLRWTSRAVVVVAVCIVCSSCAWNSQVSRQEETARKLNKDIGDFYENMAQAYYLLGYGYYELYRKAAEEGETKKAEQFRETAGLYKMHSEDMRKALNIWRQESASAMMVGPAPVPAAEDAVALPAEAPEAESEERIDSVPAALESSGNAEPTSTSERLVFW